MSRRLTLLLAFLAVIAGVAFWRRVIRTSPAAVSQARVDEAARRYLQLRKMEEDAERDAWAPAGWAARVDELLARLTEQTLSADDLSRISPSLAGDLRSGEGWKLTWLKINLLSVREQRIGNSTNLVAELVGEAVARRGDASIEIKSMRFEASARLETVPELRLRHLEVNSSHLAESKAPAFRLWADLLVPTNGVGLFVDPLLLDYDGGRARLILAGSGKAAVLTNGDWEWSPADYGPAERVIAATIADLDRDGVREEVAADATGVRMRKGNAWKTLWSAPAKLRQPQSISAGDVDGDGDADLWITQYKLPYVGGQFPTPYYDANDGYPSFLLRNDGDHFTDVTESSGLAPKRSRRTYSASFVDLDSDGDQDLVNVSDFAGVDVYLNDGKGRFSDITSTLGDTRHLFGMAHVLADFNGDALPDLLAIGMGSAAASQLDALDLGRVEFPLHTAKRSPMTYGNRVFLGRRSASETYGLIQAPWTGELRRGGWAWGVAVFDWNNDGFDDVYMANGHETFESRVDFERQFWLHDIYVGGSTNDPAALLYFMQANEKRRAARQSYGGWQANRLFTGAASGNFEENAWVVGLALTEDCRNVIAGDFDDDGRVDLAVTTYEQWPVFRQRLLIFRNESEPQGNWIGFRFAGDTTGCRVEVETGKGTRRRWFVTGDSYRSQSNCDAHFGLGKSIGIPKAEIVLPDNRRIALPTDINRWHLIPNDR